jgi:hypothetical protein
MSNPYEDPTYFIVEKRFEEHFKKDVQERKKEIEYLLRSSFQNTGISVIKALGVINTDINGMNNILNMLVKENKMYYRDDRREYFFYNIPKNANQENA